MTETATTSQTPKAKRQRHRRSAEFLRRRRRTSVYTTGEVAKYCQCSPRTVVNMFDAGVFGTIGNGTYKIGKDRRITHDSLMLYLKRTGIPIPKDLQKKSDELAILKGL